MWTLEYFSEISLSIICVACWNVWITDNICHMAVLMHLICYCILAETFAADTLVIVVPLNLLKTCNIRDVARVLILGYGASLLRKSCWQGCIDWRTVVCKGWNHTNLLSGKQFQFASRKGPACDSKILLWKIAYFDALQQLLWISANPTADQSLFDEQQFTMGGYKLALALKLFLLHAMGGVQSSAIERVTIYG